MFKYLSGIILLYIFSNTAYAQEMPDSRLTEAVYKRKVYLKNDKFVGLTAYYEPGFIFNRNNLQFNIRGGYFITNRLAIGASAYTVFFKDERYGGVKKNQVLIGPILRYHFINARVSPFTEVSMQWGNNKLSEANEPVIRTSVSYISVTPGVSLKLNKDITIDIDIRLMKNLTESLTVIEFLPLAGIHYTF